MRIHFSADDVKLDVAKAAGGQFAPTLASAKNGSVLIELAKAELQGFLMAFAQAAAAEQGAKIESAELTLRQAADRAVAATLRVKAKKAFVPATVTVDGRADVDDRLTVTLSGLRAAGEGMVGSMVAGLLEGKLKQFEGKAFDVAPPALRNVRLRDLKVDAGDPVRLTAAFES
ncbi:MAG: hypothetical protein JWO31_3513 [Phycisphaerales bacterium]|nr:hypothetical protein [Phycisphaerales bacterium]